MGLFDSIGQDISNIGSSVSSGLSSVGDFFSQGVKSVGNFYGFNNNGQWTNSGGVFKWLDEGVGEVTGRNQSRASLNLATNQFNYAQQQAQDLINQQNWNRQQSDMMASNTAAASRASGASRSGINYGNATPLAMGPGFSGTPGGKDFLGL